MNWRFDRTAFPEPELTLSFERPIPESDDKTLAAYIQKQTRIVRDTEKPFVYFGIGTANECANHTCDSGDVDLKKLAEQQAPEKLLEFAKSKGYTPIVINVDDYEGKNFVRGLFPLSGYTVAPKGEAVSPQAVAEMFDAAIDNGGYAVLVNGVADLNEELTNPGDGGKPSFYLFAGIERIMFEMDAENIKQRFLYVSAFLAERDYYNLYRPARLSNEEQWFAYRLGLPEILIEDLPD